MPKVPNKLTKTPTDNAAKLYAENGDGTTSPYDSSIRWALYDHERSNETLGGAMDQLTGELEDLNNHVGELDGSVSRLSDKLDELIDLLKARNQGAESTNIPF